MLSTVGGHENLNFAVIEQTHYINVAADLAKRSAMICLKIPNGYI